MARSDVVARALGMTVFVVGIGVLVFVFVMAYNMFTSPGLGSTMVAMGGPGPSVAQNLGSSALIVLVKIGLLFIMALVGSLVAGRGIQLYFAGEPVLEEKT